VAERRPPSPARLRRALAAGDSPISSFSVRVASFAAVLVLLPGLGRVATARFEEALRAALAHPEKAVPWSLATDVATLVAPLLIVGAAAAFAAGLVQTGAAVTIRRRGSAFARLFDGARVLDVARAFVLAVGVVAVSWYAVAHVLPLLAHHIGKSAVLLEDAGGAASRIAWSALALAFSLAVADVFVRRAFWLRRLSPSPEEAKRERREAEGVPEVRHARRRAHEALLRDDEARRR
jgi:flagellar biosynthesis protein FlhB